jgi:hypothetical protein
MSRPSTTADTNSSSSGSSDSTGSENAAKATPFTIILTMPRKKEQQHHTGIFSDIVSALPDLEMKERLQIKDEELRMLEYNARRDKRDEITSALKTICSQEGVSPTNEQRDFKTGKIRRCTVESTKPFELSKEVELLDGLEYLNVRNCSKIPKQITSLPFLETLELCELQQPPQMPNLNLPSVKKLCIKNLTDDHMTKGDEFIDWMRTHLTSLEILEMNQTKGDSFKILQCTLLSYEYISFRESLEVLEMNSCSMDDEDFTFIISDFLPAFPNLKTIQIGGTKPPVGGCNYLVSAAAAITTKLKELGTIPFQSLEKFIVPAGTLHYDTDISAAIELASELKRLHYIGYPPESKSQPEYRFYQDVSLQYLLKLNMGGRTLLDPGIRPKNGSVEPLAKEKEFPPSLWPKVLERAYSKSNGNGGKSIVLEYNEHYYHGLYRGNSPPNGRTDANALYYLLRHGPVLHERDLDFKHTKSSEDPKKRFKKKKRRHRGNSKDKSRKKGKKTKS